MLKKSLLILAFLLSGCSGLGFEKRATLMPDAAGMYYEIAPTGASRDWRDLKVGFRTDWKFSAPALKEKK
jgi:hypothetical protein